MIKSRSLHATDAAAHGARAEAVAIPVKHLPYLRFLSVVFNKPLNEVAARFLRKRR